MDAIEQTNAAIDMLTPLVEHTSIDLVVHSWDLATATGQRFAAGRQP